jgi:hypothetical protein
MIGTMITAATAYQTRLSLKSIGAPFYELRAFCGSASAAAGAAGCVTGLDSGRMNRLPAAAGMADEAVVVRSQRDFYDQMIRARDAPGRGRAAGRLSSARRRA